MGNKRGSKNILLVYPRFPSNTYWSFSYSLPFVGKKSSMPPLGLITVAAMLPKEYSVRLVDLNIEDLKDEDITWADAVFTSSMIVQKDSLEKIISRANKLEVPVVAGGPYPTQYYDQIKGVDHFVLGEAESGALEAFLRDFEKGVAKKAYARPAIRKRQQGKYIDEDYFKALVEFFRDKGDIKLASCRPDMSSSPIPRFDLLKTKEYNSMSIQTTRGCPFPCDFCNEVTLFGDTPRVKLSERVVKELKAIYDSGYRGSVFIVDDNFIGNARKAKEVLQGIIDFQKDKRYPFNIFTEASLNLAKDEELMGLMRDAGFNMVFVGIENLDKVVLKSMNKYQNVNTNILKDVWKIQSYGGMEVTAGFIVGNDNDPPDIYDKIFDFCHKAGIPTAMVGLLTAVKGSELYERLKKEGRLLGDYSGNNTHSFELNFKPANGRDASEISKAYKNFLSKFYDAKGKNYLKRCEVLLDNLGYNPKPSRDVGMTEIRALLGSLFVQTSYFGLNYLRFMSHSAIKHTELFPAAVRLSIQGHHFTKITSLSIKADSLNSRFREYVESYKLRISQSLSSEFAERQKQYYRLIKEKDAFLAEARKRIERLPFDYRRGLVETYKWAAERLNNLVVERRQPS